MLNLETRSFSLFALCRKEVKEVKGKKKELKLEIFK
jgi:hypothetical protein